MRRPHILTRAGLLVLSLAYTAFAGPGDYIVTLKNSSNLTSVSQQYSLLVKALLHDRVFLAQLPQGFLGTLIANALKASPLVDSVESDVQIVLPEVQSHPSLRTYPASTTTCASPAVPTAKLIPAFYYADQPAVCQISLPGAQQSYGKGYGVKMALIDTWVDWTHPGFQGTIDLMHSMSFLDPQKQILLMQETSPMVDQETSPMVDQETSPMVDGSGTIILNQETSPMVDQETSPMVDSKNPPYAGHGTGVAGIMHLVAPGATIAALEAFSSSTGSGSLSSIVSAIYYAVDKAHADVINMSFTVPSNTQNIGNLQTAIAYAQSMGVVVVASVPDSGGGLSYPAAYSGVSSVACSDSNDAVCSFSGNVGWATINAPGYQVMSLYPWGRHALYTGTSFSAPWVTGAGALISGQGKFGSVPAGSQSQAVQTAVSSGDHVNGIERLDVKSAINAALNPSHR